MAYGDVELCEKLVEVCLERLNVRLVCSAGPQQHQSAIDVTRNVRHDTGEARVSESIELVLDG